VKFRNHSKRLITVVHVEERDFLERLTAECQNGLRATTPISACVQPQFPSSPAVHDAASAASYSNSGPSNESFQSPSKSDWIPTSPDATTISTSTACSSERIPTRPNTIASSTNWIRSVSAANAAAIPRSTNHDATASPASGTSDAWLSSRKDTDGSTTATANISITADDGSATTAARHVPTVSTSSATSRKTPLHHHCPLWSLWFQTLVPPQ
jgi:hypothetical protein